MDLLRMVLYAENVFCIYRNYNYFKNVSKKLILLRIVIEIFIIICTIAIRINYFNETFKTDVVFCLSVTINSIFLLLVAVHHSQTFKKLVTHFKMYRNYFPDDNIYTKKKNSEQKVVIILTSFYYVFRIIVSTVIEMSFNKISLDNYRDVLVHIGFVNSFICELRFILEFSLLYVCLFGIADQLQGIMDSIDKETTLGNDGSGKMKALCEHNSVILTKNCKELVRLFDKWSAAYVTIKKCSQLGNTVFGVQVTVMLCIIIIFYIMLLYAITALGLTGSCLIFQIQYVFGLIEYIMALLVLSRAAQAAHNKANALRQKLSLLVTHSIGCKVQYNSTRDFLRIVTTHPIHTVGFGSIIVDMTLMPTCIAFCTSYTVIALQFNNIL